MIDRVMAAQKKAAMPGIEEQSEILMAIIKKYGSKHNVLIGHSYGGPIVGNVGLDSAGDIDAVVMIAPLVDPDSEPLRWYSYFSYWRLTSWLLPKDLVVAGSEKFAHAAELEKIRSKWSMAKGRFIHIHGLKDGLAPGVENVDFLKDHLPPESLQSVVYDDKGHLIIWSEYDEMKAIILKVLKGL